MDDIGGGENLNRYTIEPASIRHVRPMSVRMRPEAAMALDGYGFNPRAALRRAFVASFHCRTAMMDGHPVAMWGAAGTLMGYQAYVWLVLSDEIRAMPRAILKEARADLESVMEDRPEIIATVLPDDEAAIRFARHLGFTGDERIPLGDRHAIKLGYHPEAIREH